MSLSAAPPGRHTAADGRQPTWDFPSCSAAFALGT
jgi:hypothetical protein